MPYQYLDDMTKEDIAFQATGKTLEELFMSASDAVMQVMVVDLNEIGFKQEQALDLNERSLDLLLYQFLNEFIYYKDAQNLLLRCQKINIKQVKENYELQALVNGEVIDRKRHRLKTDIKAITLYRLQVTKHHYGWQATVVVDV